MEFLKYLLESHKFFCRQSQHYVMGNWAESEKKYFWYNTKEKQKRYIFYKTFFIVAYIRFMRMSIIDAMRIINTTKNMSD